MVKESKPHAIESRAHLGGIMALFETGKRIMRKEGHLAFRLAVCQFLGTSAAISLGSILSRIWGPPTVSLFGSRLADFGVALLYGLVMGVQLYFVVFFVLVFAYASIVKHAFIWCIGIPTALLLLTLVVFPPNEYGGIFWISLIPLSALFAGVIFYFWLRRSPLPIQ